MTFRYTVWSVKHLSCDIECLTNSFDVAEKAAFVIVDETYTGLPAVITDSKNPSPRPLNIYSRKIYYGTPGITRTPKLGE